MPSNTNLLFTLPSKIGIKPVGEVRLGGTEGMIGCKDDFNWEIKNQDSISHLRQGGYAGQVEFEEFTYKKLNDSSSVALFMAFSKQASFSGVEIRCYKPIGEDSVLNSEPFMKWVLAGLVITEMSFEETEDGTIEEELKFKFQACTLKYSKQLVDGTLIPSGEFSWNVRTNSQNPEAVS